MKINAEFIPSMVSSLFDETKRYLIYYGGRGGGKSWGIARSLIIRCLKKPLRILCVRETMTSIEDSVYKLLVDQIHALGVSSHFHIERKTIYGLNGTEFRFAGIRSNPDALKSSEGIDICWAEEAQTITKTSWQKLIPTIRKPNSQIIISFNPELEVDETFQRFVVNTPPNGILTKINYLDNPFCPDVLKEEAELLRQRDPEAYHNVWLGYPMATVTNAVYGKEIRQLEQDGRLTKVPYDSAAPVHCFWDLGWRDSTSIILAQMVGFEFHVIDFIEASSTAIPDFFTLLDRKPYHYGIHYLPHDATAVERGTGRSIEEVMRNSGKTVRIVPKLSVTDGINAARMMFPRLWIDQEKCHELMHHLRHYVWDPKGGKNVPLHDAASHAADAFRYMATSLTDIKPAKDTWKRSQTPIIRPSPNYRVQNRGTGWMA